MRDQQPAATSLLDMMQPSACDMPGKFAQPEAHITLHYLAECVVILYLAPQGIAPDAKSRSWNLHDYVENRLMDANQWEEVGNALSTNSSNFNCPPVRQSLGNTDQSSVDKMDVLDRLVSTADSLPADQTHW